MSEHIVASTCPNCGQYNYREVYDIGSGPEVSCASCEWCWGALGQQLKPLDVAGILAEAEREREKHRGN